MISDAFAPSKSKARTDGIRSFTHLSANSPSRVFAPQNYYPETSNRLVSDGKNERSLEVPFLLRSN